MKHTDKSSTILMFVVFFLTFYVLWNIADLVSKVDHQKEGNTTYAHTMTINLQFSKLVELVENGKVDEGKEHVKSKWEELFKEIGQINGCNVSVSNLYFTIKSKKDNVLCEIILKENVSLPYENQEEYDNSGTLFIGESLKEFIFEENNQHYLCMNDEIYSVGAVLKNYGINQQDDRVIILYQRLSDAEKEKIKEQLIDYYVQGYTEGIELTFGSESERNVENAYEEIENYFELIEDVDVGAGYAREQTGELNYWYEFYRSVFGGISMCFALLNGVVVSILWFQRHKKEFIIRVTYGYSKGRIWCLMIKKMVEIAGCAFLSSTVTWGLWQVVQMDDISWRMMLIQCGIMLVGVMCVLIITTLYPLKKVLALDPAEALCKYGR